MKVKLHLSDFVNDKLLVTYGPDNTRQALFTIIDEEYQGNTRIGRINKITILTRTVKDNEVSDAVLQSGIIGMGNGTVGVLSDDTTLLGKQLNKDNMESCTIWLYEEGDE